MFKSNLGIKVLFSLCFSQLIANACGVFYINTWAFENAAKIGWETLKKTDSAEEAVVEGCRRCEVDQCDFTVGYGGSPDENGASALDAMIMDGTSMDVGSVAAMSDIKEAIKVAQAVMKHTQHTLLVGRAATEFALQMGFKLNNLSTEHSINQWKDWKNRSCQPNFWKNTVYPDPTKHCGPYKPIRNHSNNRNNNHHNNNNNNNPFFNNNNNNNNNPFFNNNNHYNNNNNNNPFFNNKNHYNNEEMWSSPVDEHNHDTIGAVAIDSRGNVVAGTSTNGAAFKIPGRVGDSPITGSGAYADSSVGGASATGDGDVMMRFLPSFLVVELMRGGSTPTSACAEAIKRIKKFYPKFFGGIVAVNKRGEFGAACSGMASFPFMVGSEGGVKKYHVQC